MKFVNINDKLAPIRILRQVDAVTDAELMEFLAQEGAIKQTQAAQDERWAEVIDCRHFIGLTSSQREICVRWLATHLRTIQQVSLGVAFVVGPEIEPRAQIIVDVLKRMQVPARTTRDLDTALYWALEQALDEDVAVDPNLVLNGVDAFRPTIE